MTINHNCCNCGEGPICFGCQLESELPTWSLSFSPGLTYNVAQNADDTDTGGGGQEYYVERRYPDISGVNSLTLNALTATSSESAPAAFFPKVPASCSWGGIAGYDFHWQQSNRTDLFESADNTCTPIAPEEIASQAHDGTWIHPYKFLTAGPNFQAEDSNCGISTGCGSYVYNCGWGVAGMYVYLEITQRDWGSGSELSLICRMYFVSPIYAYEDKGGTPYQTYMLGAWLRSLGMSESNWNSVFATLYPDHPGGLTSLQMAEECVSPHKNSITTVATQLNQEWGKAVDCSELSEAVVLPLTETLVGEHSGTNLWTALGILNIPSSITVTPNYA